MLDSARLKHFHLSANSSLGRRAFVMSSSKRTRSRRSKRESAFRRCSQLNAVLAVSLIWAGSLPVQLSDFTFQCLARFRSLHLGSGPENHRDPDGLLLGRRRVIYGLAKIPVPFLAARGHVTPLTRCTHSFLNFCGGNNWACT